MYAVKNGYDKVNNVEICNQTYSTWGACQKVTSGVKGAKFKSFPNMSEALDWLEDSQVTEKSAGNYNELCLHAYIDGSYNPKTGEYGYSAVLVKNNIIKEIIYGKDQDTNGSRQINGELRGAVATLTAAVKNSYSEVVIFHDYMGVACHATGEWKLFTRQAREYNLVMKDLLSKVETNFVHVSAHTGDLYNELADDLAKLGIDVQSTNAVSKLLRNGEKIVTDDRKVASILSGMYEVSNIKLVALEGRC